MSLQQLIDEHVASVFLNTDHFAENVIRFAEGNETAASVVKAVVSWVPDAVEDSRGRGVMRRAELFLDDSVRVTIKDAFRIGGVRYDVETIGAVSHGARTVSVVRYIPEQKGGSPLKTGDF